MRRTLASAIALVTISCYGCASSLPPAQVAMSDEYASGQVRAQRVLLMPADVAVTVFGENGQPAQQQIMQGASQYAAAMLQDSARMSLLRRGYQIAAELQWDGIAMFPDGRSVQALTPEEMAEVATALADNQMPRIELLAKAQTATGSDAAFQLSAAGQDIPGESSGEKVAKGVAIALFFVVIVAALIISSKGGKGVSAPSGAARVGVGTAHLVRPAAAAVIRPAILPIPPIFYAPPPPPEHENESGMGVSMRMFDLRATQVLWSADEWAEGSPRDAGFVKALGGHVGASIPPAR
jgi:hypothetical protein